MGQNSACCNPTSQLIEPETLFFPKESLTTEPLTELPQELLEPTQEVLQTLKKGEQYLLKNFGRVVTLDSDELWRVETRRTGGRETVHGRGGSRSGGLSGMVMLYFPNREVFKGEVQDRRPTFGVFVFKNGCFYAGEMRGCNAEGQGRYENRDTGYAYEGSWSKSLPHGRGSETYANGDRFEGELMYGAKFGTGTYHFHSGNLYEGSFYYNQSDGRGKITYANGNTYDGQWKLGLFNGHGRFHWTNGETYEGEYVDGKRQGFGKYMFRNGSYYEGMWVGGVQNGKGVVCEKFDEIKGEWEMGDLIG